MGINILVVDDSTVMRSMINKVLGMTGISIGDVRQANNGREGLAVLEEHWIDLVIADINMPVMNGEEMIDQIREKPEFGRLPIIVISTEGSRRRIDRLTGKGVHFIHKPFSPEKIRDAILEVTGLEVEERENDDFSELDDDSF